MEIVWLEDRHGLRYVRKVIEFCHFRRRRPGGWSNMPGKGRLVGYQVLPKDTRGSFGMFKRVLFYVNDWDWCNEPDGVYHLGAPCEAVDVETLQQFSLDHWIFKAEEVD